MKVQVYLLESNREYDILYTYLAPTASFRDVLPVRGTFVQVPFGPQNKPREAVVWDCCASDTEAHAAAYRLKTILQIEPDTPPLNARELDLCLALQKQYLCTFGDAVRCVRPYRGKRQDVGVSVQFVALCQAPEAVRQAIDGGVYRQIGQIRILEILLEQGEAMPKEQLLAAAGCSDSGIKTLVKKGVVRVDVQKVDRGADDVLLPSHELQLPVYAKHPLNDAQQAAFQAVRTAIEREIPGTFLLHGVTGSGKTEVYMQLIHWVVNRGGHTVMLVPEISLTPQLLSLFTARFGHQVAVLHSRLTDAQRRREWGRIQRGEVHIVVGARSAVFAPFAQVDLMILDEVHDSSYRAEEAGLKYHAKEVAEIRCRAKGVVLCGSATPDVSMVYAAKQGRIGYLPLPERVRHLPLPTVSLVDMREEARAAGCVPIFSRELIARMKENYRQGLQTLLFVGRRGYSSGLLCRECGRSMKCRKCNVAMTYHASGKRLICHYCGNTVQAPTSCPACGSTYLEYRGIGTERVQQELQRLFPGAQVLRMDADTTAKKDGHARILKTFAEDRVPFMVGTQMITKGHDFPGVTLVGVLHTDGLLNAPDYRSGERAFQLLTQVSGRAGRGDYPGHVVIQAYDVDHYAITAAQHHDYGEFYQNEIVIRENLWYPPYCTVCSLQLQCEDDRAGFVAWKEAVAMLRNLLPQLTLQGPVEVWGPSRAPVPKVNGLYRWVIHIKAQDRADAVLLLQTWLPQKKLANKMRLTYTFE